MVVLCAELSNAMVRAYSADTATTGNTKLDFARTPGLNGVRKTYESGMCMVYRNDSTDVYVRTGCALPCVVRCFFVV